MYKEEEFSINVILIENFEKFRHAFGAINVKMSTKVKKIFFGFRLKLCHDRSETYFPTNHIFRSKMPFFYFSARMMLATELCWRFHDFMFKCEAVGSRMIENVKIGH